MFIDYTSPVPIIYLLDTDVLRYEVPDHFYYEEKFFRYDNKSLVIDYTRDKNGFLAKIVPTGEICHKHTLQDCGKSI